MNITRSNCSIRDSSTSTSGFYPSEIKRTEKTHGKRKKIVNGLCSDSNRLHIVTCINDPSKFFWKNTYASVLRKDWQRFVTRAPNTAVSQTSIQQISRQWTFIGCLTCFPRPRPPVLWSMSIQWPTRVIRLLVTSSVLTSSSLLQVRAKDCG